MNGEFLFKCFGSIDDCLISMSVNRIGKIKNERRAKFITLITAASLTVSLIPVTASYIASSYISVSPVKAEEAPCIIYNQYYQPIGDEMFAQYGLIEKPTLDLAEEYIGAYLNLGGDIINVYRCRNTSADNILLGERNGRCFYLLFISKEDSFSETKDFLSFLGYTSETDIVTMSVNGKNITDRDKISKLWSAINGSFITSKNEYEYAVYHGEWSYEKEQEERNSFIYIELNFGMTNYLHIAYSPSTGYFLSHFTYFKVR